MALAERAEQLVDSGAGTRPRSEASEGVSAARQWKDEREQEDGAPSELGDAGSASVGQRAVRRGFEGLKARPTTGILSGFRRMFIRFGGFAAPWCNWQHA